MRLVRTGRPRADWAVARAGRFADDAVLLSMRPDGRVGRGLAAAGSLVSRRGVGWAATTAALVAAGGRHRRAGVEGLVAWQVATLAAGAVKRVVARRRPSLPRVLGPETRSSSMPSSHTASAVAYAVAAALADPPVAPVVGSFAGLVAWSRMAAQRHFASDVAVGVAVGAATGAAVHAVARRAGPSTDPATDGAPDGAPGGSADSTSTGRDGSPARP